MTNAGTVRHGGRYFDDGKGNLRKADPKKGEHDNYPPAPEPEPENSDDTEAKAKESK